MCLHIVVIAVLGPQWLKQGLVHLCGGWNLRSTSIELSELRQSRLILKWLNGADLQKGRMKPMSAALLWLKSSVAVQSALYM